MILLKCLSDELFHLGCYLHVYLSVNLFLLYSKNFTALWLVSNDRSLGVIKQCVHI